MAFRTNFRLERREKLRIAGEAMRAEPDVDIRAPTPPSHAPSRLSMSAGPRSLWLGLSLPTFRALDKRGRVRGIPGASSMGVDIKSEVVVSCFVEGCRLASCLASRVCLSLALSAAAAAFFRWASLAAACLDFWRCRLSWTRGETREAGKRQ